MKTKIDEAEVEIVNIEIQFGVKMPIDVIVRKTSAYGGESTYGVRDLHGKFERQTVDDMVDIGARVYAQAIEVVKKFEENEKE